MKLDILGGKFETETYLGIIRDVFFHCNLLGDAFADSTFSVGLSLIPGSPKAPGRKASDVSSWSNWIGVWPLAVWGVEQVVHSDRAGIVAATRSFLS